MKTGNLEGMSYESLREMARRRLPKGIFEYIDRGAEDETALAYNRRCFERIRMRPKILVDVSVRTPEIELFGRKQALPLLVSPTAATGLVRHKGEIDLARAAAKANIPFCAATEAITAFEEVVAATKGNIWFQLYFWKDRRLSYGLVDRAREAGIDTLLVTVDTAVLPKREYNLRNGYDVPLRPSLRNLCDVATHPRWFVDVLLRYLLKGGMPRHGNYPEVYRRPVTGGKIAEYCRRASNPSLLKYRNSISFQANSGFLQLRGMPIIVPPHVAVRESPGSKIGIGIIRIFPARPGAYSLM